MRIFLLGYACALALAAATPRLVPAPGQMERGEGAFVLDETVRILLPDASSQEDRFLAGLLSAELSDWHGLAAGRGRAGSSARAIVMGSIENPLVRSHCARLGITVTASDPGPEGYVLRVTPDLVLVAGSDARGAFYGFQSLRQLIARNGTRREIPVVRVLDRPYKPFRAFRLYLPSREEIPYFKKLVRDVLARYKYNCLILEMNAAMRFDRHPELNAGWIEFAKDLNYSRRDRPSGPNREFMDSANHDTADGRVLEKDEVADIVRFARQYYMDVIPEIPSLTHSYYLLTRHRELAEMQDWEWPDSYCPSNPKSYHLLFDVLDEFLGVMRPSMVNIGHDEWRIAAGACPRCRGRRPTDLWAEDVNRIYRHLKSRNVRTALWGDHMVEDVRGRQTSDQRTPGGLRYQWPGALSPDQVKRLIPKDILVLNWFWSDGKTSGEESAAMSQGEKNTRLIENFGFRQVLGNLEPEIAGWGRRSARPGILGGAPSSWATTSELAIGKDLMHDIIGCAGLLWSVRWPAPGELRTIVQQELPSIRRYLSGRNPPSEDGDPIDPTPPVPGAVVAADFDPSSLIFRHACERPARNDWSHRYVYNVDDTADLLGHYEVVYDDGFVATIPIRYGVNILERTWRQNGNPRSYCYLCDPVPAGDATFFDFEWRNPRFGKAIREVRLRPSTGFVGTSRKRIADNAVLLSSLRQVRKRVGQDTNR
ncbi:MAG: beta-N-acetylhexosaminidase [Acidobacteria bacterium]|nr:beta-N-acetylhexosaminidase [Acidobacteriota bacterium]